MSAPVIIGGGPAGAAAATLLARAGRAVTLIERTTTATHKVCGDFLSAEAIAAVTALGLDLRPLAPAPITTLRLLHGTNVATTRLPFPALGLTRRVLDEALLRHAADQGATVLRGHTIRGIRHVGASLHLDSSTLDPIVSDTAFLATGKHDLHGMPRPGRGLGPVGLKMYYALAPRIRDDLRGHIELVLFAGGYAGLQLVDADQAVLCLLVSRATMRAVGGDWGTLLDSLTAECPHLADRLCDARPLLHRPLAIAGLPYGYRYAPAENAPPGLFRLGDQAAVIASLTGDGVALALVSASLATRTWLEQGNNAAQYHRSLARGAARQMRFASLLHRFSRAGALQPWLLHACRIWPGAMRLAAAWTRVPAAFAPT
jgi:flavin-dependent dehydrogenase